MEGVIEGDQGVTKKVKVNPEEGEGDRLEEFYHQSIRAIGVDSKSTVGELIEKIH